MKRFYFSILIIILVASCKKDIAFEDEYSNSYRTWLDFKQKNNNTYQYTKTYSSWVGTSSEYVITVKKGLVTNQSYKQMKSVPNGSGPIIVTDSWEENEVSLNTHHSDLKALTLDEVYRLAKSKWLNVNDKENSIYFESKNGGLISTCGYFPKNCADDCFIGISIKEIKSIN